MLRENLPWQELLRSDPLHPAQDQAGWLMSYLDVFILTTALFATLYFLKPAQETAESPWLAVSPAAIAELPPPAAGFPAVGKPIAGNPSADNATPVNATPVARDAAMAERPMNPELPTAGFEAPARQSPESWPTAVQREEREDHTRLRIGDSVLFAASAAELTPAGMALLSELMPILQDSEGEILIEGHTDSAPIRTEAYPSNWELGSARAMSVLHFLSAQGVEPGRLRAMSYADTRPIAANEDPGRRPLNRRVEIVLLKAPHRWTTAASG